MQTSIITFDGKLDQLVGFKNSKGTYSLRKRITPKNPNTANQRVVRSVFKAAVAAASALKNNLQGLIPAANQLRISPRNMFVKLNTHSYGLIEDPQTGAIGARLEWNELKLSTGSNHNVLTPAIQVLPGQVMLSWAANSHGDDDLDDPVYVIGIDTKDMAVFSTNAKRRDGQATIENIPANRATNHLEVYIFTQHFLTAAARASYELYLNNQGINAESFLSSSAANSVFSPTEFAGEATLQ